MAIIQHETKRLDLLSEFGILDTPPEEAFDDIAFIAAQICGAPIALVSLLDRHRQWFKAHLGLEASETPIDQSVCKLNIDRPELLIIPDLTLDDRTRDNPLVLEEPLIRFYAGAALVSTSGIAIGRLCVIDKVPRPAGLTEDQRKMLVALARQVMVQLEQRQAVRAAAELARYQSCLVTVGDHVRASSTVEELTFGTAELVGGALGVDRAGFGLVDPATEMVTIEFDWTADGVTSIAGAHRFSDYGRIRDELAAGHPLVIHDVETDPRTSHDPAAMQALAIGALVNMPVREQGATIAVLIVQSRARRAWSDTELTFLRSVADRLEAGVARLKIEQQQQILNREISHRLKNMLAMVQAIASQTFRHVTEREPIDTFERRLIALGTAHDVLMLADWTAAPLSDVLDAVLGTFGFGERIDREGPPIMLGARAALSFSLLIHELTTNAAKYGALSNGSGRVSVTWRIHRRDAEPTLLLGWRESGGPPITTPARTGFGSRLIRLGLVGTGGVELRYPASGLEADMTAAISHLETD